MKIATTSGIKVGELAKSKDTKSGNEDSVIYSIPCNICDKEYIGETGRGLDKRIAEHKNDVRKHRTSNSLVVHVDSHKHLPNWDAVTELDVGLNKRMRKAIEAAYICNKNVTNHREGFIKWAAPAAKLALRGIASRSPRGQRS